MTVVAYDRRVLAVDSRITGGGSGVSDRATKIWRVGGGRFFAGAGLYEDCLVVRDWIRDGMDPKRKPRLTDFEGMLVTPDGGVLALEGRLIPYPVYEHHACGSGGIAAIASMDRDVALGREPCARGAVQVAIGRDKDCGGQVKWVRVR